jgi:hypothetical protein
LIYPPKPKRKYNLSKHGRESLQKAVRKTKPWKHTTGPRTREGKMIVSQNALKHGLFARDAGRNRAEFAALLREIREAMEAGQ